MPRFPNALRAWQCEDFSRILKQEIEDMDTGALPLSRASSRGGVVDASGITAMPLRSTDDERFIVANVGVFFTEILAACSCGEDPAETNAYCQLQIRIDKASAEADIRILPD